MSLFLGGTSEGKILKTVKEMSSRSCTMLDAGDTLELGSGVVSEGPPLFPVVLLLAVG